MAQHSSRSIGACPQVDFQTDQSDRDASGLTPQDTLGNQEMLDRVSGLTGQTFNRIVGAEDGDTTTADRDFGTEDLRAYFGGHLQLAKDEFWTDKKVNGSADGVLAKHDQDDDSRVTWEEFQTFRGQMLASIAPGVSKGADASEVEGCAAEVFSKLQADGAGYKALEEHTRGLLHPDTDHKDLIAQLGALLLLDVGDRDEQSANPRDRTLTEEEWMNMAADLSSTPG